MAQNLAQYLINLSYGSLRTNEATKLALNHREGSFCVRPLVVVLQEGFPIEIIEVPHAIPEPVKLMVMVSCQ